MRKKLIILAVLLSVVAAVIGGLATFWTEYEWFVDLGFGSVYVTVLLARLGTGVVFGLVALLALALHVVLIRRYSKPRRDWTFATPEGDIDLREIIAKVSTPVVIAGAIVVAAAMGYWASLHWEDVLKFLNQTPFNQSEPILKRDEGFYLFTLPLLQFAQQWLIYLTGLCVVLSAVVYFSRGAIAMKGRLPEMSEDVRGHLLFALACVLVTIGWGFHIEMFETLFSKRGVAYGATYTDVYANLIAYRVMIAACAVAAVYLLYSIRGDRGKGAGRIKRPGYVLAGVVGLYVLGVFVWPTVVQRVIVNPNELEKERPYLEHAIAGTRRAYGLDRVEVKHFPATEKLSLAQLHQNSATIANVKIWDHRPLQNTYKQLQVIRLYYDFPNISIDRYRIGDNYWQVMLSARELVHDQLPLQSQTWVNRHLQYTHGYGVCLSPVNQSSVEGLPDLWIKDIPPEARDPDLKVTRPEIYYGLETNDYVLVKTTTQEFDYPRGDDNVYTTYKGEGGVGIGSFFRRLLLAVRFGDVNLLFTKHLTPDSRILFNREIQQRVSTVAPFLMLDDEPYITVVDGRMYWIQDAYTVSYRFPYSQPTPLGRRRRINYIRNSVKVVVDAYNGRVQLYVWDSKDPLITTYTKIFPALFKKAEQMPPSLRAHVRYPKDLFTIQAAMYESFHMTDPRVFYNQEDKWGISREPEDRERAPRAPAAPRQGFLRPKASPDNGNRMSPYFMIMKLPGEEQEEFLLMVPFTPANKDNMVAWMTARCDGDNYGKLRVYKFPKQKLIFGPMQIEARINQNEDISQWITLRNQHGSKVIRGDLLVIPIEKSILYVQPVFLESTQMQLPELKQVIVAFGQRVEMRATLQQSLEAVFGVEKKVAARSGEEQDDDGAADSAAQAVPHRVLKLANDALRLYKTGEKELSHGDWSSYGKAQQELKRKLKALSEALQPGLSPPSNTVGGRAGATPDSTPTDSTPTGSTPTNP